MTPAVDPVASLQPAHTRCLDLALFQGEGELVSFRADILDLRKAGLMELAGRIATAGIIHNMTLQGDFEVTSGRLVRLDWEQSHVMHEANRATRGECCRDPMSRLSALVGTRLGESFRADLKQCFGGPLGCTHVNTLFQELSACVARLQDLRERHGVLREARVPGERVARRSIYFDAFLPEDSQSSALRVRLTDSLFAPARPAPAEGDEHLFGHDEVRLAAEVGLLGWQLESLGASQRIRRGPIFGPDPWIDRSQDVGELAGRSLGGGFAKACAGMLGADPEQACLLSALLCLAPGMTQVGAALSDSLEPSPVARPAQSGSPLSGPGPCYMLRSEGPLMKSIMGSGDAEGPTDS